MTPVPLDLPLRPADATEVANLVFDHAERKTLSEELRNRLAARAAALRLETITPHFGSLERDPVHPSAYYLAVDGGDSAHLLYFAPAAAPTSSIYHRPLLIGRMRRRNGAEMVISAIPFGPTKQENIETFAARISPGFYPQPQGARSTITMEGDPAAAFAFFRAAQKRTGKNVAAVEGDYHATLWAAIRAGWRAGYTAACDVTDQIPEGAYSRYRVSVPLTEAGRKRAETLHEQIRRARAVRKMVRAFDFEVNFEGPVTAAALRMALEDLREGAHTPQLVGGSFTGDLDELAAVASQYQITLTYEVARPDCGRFNYRAKSVAEAENIL